MRSSTGVIAGGVALIALLAAWGSFYTVGQGERAVITTNGALTKVDEPGFHMKLPFVQHVSKFSVQSQVAKWTCPIGNTCDSSATVLQAYSRDQQPADMAVSVTYHVPPSEVARVFSDYGSLENLADRVIFRKVPQALKTVFGKYDAVTVIQSRQQFNTDVAKAIQDSVDGPVVVDGVQVENIDFSDAYEATVEARMTAQVEVQKQEQVLAQEKVKAQTLVVQAQAQADSNLARARADAQSTQIKGDAEASAIRARGAALKDNPTLVALTTAEAWDGHLPTTMVPAGAVPFLSMVPVPAAPTAPAQ